MKLHDFSTTSSLRCESHSAIRLVLFLVFQTCALQSRETDQVPSSNPDSRHQSFDGCSFDSDGKSLNCDPNSTPARENLGTDNLCVDIRA